ncbi:lectin [Streptosporangium sp. V21-05]|uniref:lectin n=1 Tax=Streptosporangium sp. V21-05 TaxID=3446115 RepID=UPI003F53041B
MKARWRSFLAIPALLLPSLALTVGVATPAAAAPVADPAAIVNPLLGTSHEGNTFPGADAPFGMVQWSPDTPSRPPGGNYAYSDSTITGFSLTHLSGPGCNAMADIPIMPTTGAVNGTATSSFSHSAESASAGAYTVTLGNGVKTELTTTTRSGMARFTFPATNQANLLFKLGSGATSTGNLNFTAVSDTEVRGSITSGHFCASSPTYTLYFNMVFDRPFASSGSFANGNSVTFDASGNRVVHAKVGLSYVSLDGARANRAAENPNWNFDATRQATKDAWNKLLRKIEISGGTTDQQVVFYTALYHSLLHPNVVSDVDGRYRGFDHQVHTVSGGQKAQYGNFSGWDIYRTQAQLHALVAPQEAGDSAQSLVNNYTQGGTLPKWTLNEYDTYVMNGDPAPIIIAAYHAFGARNFDTAAAKAAMVRQGTVPNGIRTGLEYQSNYGYLPSDGTYPHGFYGSVATLLEYSTTDFAIGAFAGALGDTTTQNQFVNRAQNWRNALNPASGFMQPKLKDGTWRPGFTPTVSDEFVEGTSWQYTGMVPFNVRGLADAKGGNAAMAGYLDGVLSNLRGSSNNSQHADMGNEPSIGLPWEYAYIGQPWKTQRIVRQVQNEMWPNSPAGWGVGNDDLGTMSAWYVWSAMGMYPMTPGTSDLVLGSPLFTTVKVSLGGGGTITINAPQAATNAPYVQSATLNGATWNNAYLPASFAINGGTLNLTLGTTANTSWASAASSAPPSYGGNGGAHPPATVIGPTGALSSGLAGKCLDVDGANGANGNATRIWDCNGSAAQRWHLPGDGTVMLFGKCLDINGGGTANNTKVQLWDCNLSGGQQWTPVPSSGALRNPQSGRCLDVSGGNPALGTPVALWDCNGSPAQRWTLPASRTGAVPSAIAGKCLDDNAASTANGSRIQIWTCNGSAAQRVHISGDGTLRLFNRCLDATGNGTGNGTAVVLWDCNGRANQQWNHVPSTGAFVNPQSGRCLDVAGGDSTDGTRLQLWDCNGSPAQRWTLPSA